MTTVQINAAPKRLSLEQFYLLAGSRMMETMIKNCAVLVDSDGSPAGQRLWDARNAVQNWLRDNCTTHYFVQHPILHDKTEDRRWVECIYFLSARDMVHFKLAINGKKIA